MSAGLVPSEGRREELLQASPSGWGLPAAGPSLARGSIIVASAFIFACMSLYAYLSNFPFIIRTQSYWIKNHPGDLIFMNYVCNDPISK